MEMVLREGGIRDDGLNVDPVSGNEIPSGSLAEEVRDDIPAQLSGGEYVVPADVVRFFGVKFFEDLRMEAKQGLQAMERNGRIGGEPVMVAAVSSDQGITDEDLKELESMMTTGVYHGGLMDKIAYTAKNDPMVNERINKKGMAVGFANGGQVTSKFADPSEIDSIIDRVSIMAQQNPAIAKELSQRGISVRQIPDQTNVQQMQPRNTPAQVTNPVSQQMQEGGVPNPFTTYTTPGLSTSLGLPPPQPITPDVTATPPASTTTAAAPQVLAPTPTPDIGQCGQGSRWNGFSCVDDSEGPDGGGGDPTTSKPWHEGIDFEDITGFVEKTLSDVAPTKPIDKSFGEQAIGMLPSIAFLTKIDDINNLAKAKAALELGLDSGRVTQENYNTLAAKLDNATKTLGMENSFIGTGKYNRLSSRKEADEIFGNRDGKFDPKELNEWMDSLGVDMDYSGADPVKQAQVQEITILKDQAKKGGGKSKITGGDDEGPSNPEKPTKSKVSPPPAPPVSKISSNTKPNPNRKPYFAPDDDSYSGGFGWQKAKGGLMKKKKK